MRQMPIGQARLCRPRGQKKQARLKGARTPETSLSYAVKSAASRFLIAGNSSPSAANLVDPRKGFHSGGAPN